MALRGRIFVAFAGASLAAATLLGAYASHGMRGAAPETVNAVSTAVAFQFYHGLALLAVPLLAPHLAYRWAAAAGILFVVGTVFFCGGIYLSSLLDIGPASRVAPLGGMSFAAAWVALAVGALVSNRQATHSD